FNLLGDTRLKPAVQLRDLFSALVQFAKQPRVLDCDDRLVGKGAHHRNLLVGKTLDARAVETHDAYERTLAHERHSETSAKIAELLSGRDEPRRFSSWPSGVVRNVFHIYDPPLYYYPSGEGATIRQEGICQKKIPEFRCQTAPCDQPMATFTQSEHV